MNKILCFGLVCFGSFSINSHAMPLNPHIIQKSIYMEFFSKKTDSIDLIRKGVAKNTAVQGLAINNNTSTLYTIHSYGKPQNAVINRFDYDPTKSTLNALDTQKPSQFIGHQGITIDQQTNMLWASAGDAIENKGLNIIGFRYTANNDVINPIIIKVFSDDYNKNTYAMPVITPDHHFLLVRGNKNGTNVVRGYDLNHVSLDHSQDISQQASFEWVINKNFYKDKYALQGLASDGKYIYLMSGGENNQNKRIQVYDLNGQLLQNLNQVTVGKLDNLFNRKTDGYWEPEGLAIDSKNQKLLILFAAGNTKNSIGKLYSISIGN